MSEIFEARNFLELRQDLVGLFDQVRHISMILVFPFFVFSLVMEQFKGLDETPNYGRIVKKLVLFFAALAVYDTVFIYTNQIVSQIAETIFPVSDFETFKRHLWEGISGNEKGGFSIFDALRGGVTYMVLIISYVLAGVAFFFLDVIRKISLGFLYVVGPLWLAASVLPGRDKSAGKFFENVIVINGWVIVANLLMKLQSLVSMSYYERADTYIFPVVASNVALIIMLLYTPKITSLVAAGESMGGLPYVEHAFQKIRDITMVSLVASYLRKQATRVWGNYMGRRGSGSDDSSGSGGGRAGDSVR